MRELALFAGAGGGILGGLLLGWRTVCAVEIDAYARQVLLARQRDGILPRFPIWDDVRTFDGKPWRGNIDVVSGGFPCQDISAAGSGVGIEGSRSGLWREMARIIREVRPRYAFVENSPMLTVRGLGKILGDLAEMGFNARWGVLSARDVGALHLRERIWILASDADRDGLSWRALALKNACGNKQQAGHIKNEPTALLDNSIFEQAAHMLPKSYVYRGDDGVAYRVDRTRAIGNGQVPAVVRLAWNTLSGLAQ